MGFIIHRDPVPPRLIVMGGQKPPPVNAKQGRRKMSEEKKLGHETGVKKVSQEPADKQGPVGTGTEPKNPPAGEDVRIGDKEDNVNG